jgi:hypothetical protein
MTFSKIKAKETRELTRTLEKTLEAKLACSDTAVMDNKIQNNEIDKLEKELGQLFILAEYFNIMSFILS